MIKVTKFGETTYLKDWHERVINGIFYQNTAQAGDL